MFRILGANIDARPGDCVQPPLPTTPCTRKPFRDTTGKLAQPDEGDRMAQGVDDDVLGLPGPEHLGKKAPRCEARDAASTWSSRRAKDVDGVFANRGLLRDDQEYQSSIDHAPVVQQQENILIHVATLCACQGVIAS